MMKEQTGIIEVKGLSKAFGGATAVNDISFVVQSGELFGFLGPNGAGKTTTVRMLVIRSAMGTQKTIIFVTLVVVMATIAGMIFGTVWS
jgi:ABC-type multidrug transport system ATPase subunit